MSTREDIMRDYVPVNERIVAFYEKHPDGSLQSDIIELNDHRVVMRAYAYRTPTDERPGIGYSSLEIPGRTPYTKGSEVENCETSAWGRAIAALGFEVKRGIASAEEVRNKDGGDSDAGTAGSPAKPRPPTDPIIGEAVAAGRHDFELRQTPTGWQLGFRVKEGRSSIIVSAEDDMAQALKVMQDETLGKTVQVWGSWTDHTFKKNGEDISYRVLHLSRIVAPDYELPADPVISEEADLSDLPENWAEVGEKLKAVS